MMRLRIGRGYRTYILWILTLVCTLSYVDRGLIVLLLQSIKEDLYLSDTQLGFLTGIPFALFYSTLGLPIARWADRGSRSTITSVAIAVWSVTVMACVLVTNFTQFVFARVAAAVGEAGCVPPTYSLVGDYYPERSERAKAMGIFMLASPLSILTSFLVGAQLNESYGWRMTFFLLGIPGLLLALVVRMTIRDARSLQGSSRTQISQLPTMGEVMRTLWGVKAARHLLAAIILIWTLGLGLYPWYGAFMMRSHGMRTAELGMGLGLVFGVGGAVGTLLGGYVASRWLSRDEHSQMRLSALTMASLVPSLALFLLIPEKYGALLALVPLVMVFNFFQAPTFALMQRLVADNMRATVLALVLLLANLIGMGLGPQVVGILSDCLAPALGNDSLRYAMLLMSLVALWAAYHFMLVGRTVTNDLASLRSKTSGETSAPPNLQGNLQERIPIHKPSIHIGGADSR